MNCCNEQTVLRDKHYDKSAVFFSSPLTVFGISLFPALRTYSNTL